ncbi:hypothetical protein CN918_31075 [Priestia megaterium]|nr:hypothetical protein CN918_31075 [Priestia megaterium]
MSWYWRDQDRYQEEIKSWESHDFSLDIDTLNEKGQVIFKGVIVYEQTSYQFEIFYPEGYPFVAPSVKCTNQQNLKHQTPFTHTVCYHEEWVDYGFVTGEEIYQQLTKYVRGLNEGFKEEEESNHVVPDYYAGISDKAAIILAPEDLLATYESTDGYFKANIRFREDAVQAALIRFAALKENNSCRTAHELYSDADTYTGFLVNVKTAPPLFKETHELIEWVQEQTGHSDLKILCEAISASNPDLGPLLGIRYPKNGKPHFLLVSLEAEISNKHDTYVRKHKPIVFQTEIYSDDQLFKRVSHIRPLQTKHVAIIGLGAVGSPIALELTKAGVGELTLVDPDRVSIGNIVRHVSDINDVGVSKVLAVSNACKRHNPSIAVNTHREWWGWINETYVTQSLKGVDLVICCIGHTPNERYINDLTRRLEIPTIYAYASAGAISGRIFSVKGSGNGCYHCHQYAIGGNKVPSLRQPSEVTTFYDEGCASPTFLGSGIDTSSISLLASRHALQLLLKDSSASIEEANYNHLVWYAQDGLGNPQVFTENVKPHPSCSFCNPLPDVRLGDLVPMAQALERAMTDLEEAMMRGERAEEAQERLDEQITSVKDKFFLYEKSILFMVKDIVLREKDDLRCWVVMVSTEDPDITEVEFDEFFGYKQTNGMLTHRYKLVTFEENGEDEVQAQ